MLIHYSAVVSSMQNFLLQCTPSGTLHVNQLATTTDKKINKNWEERRGRKKTRINWTDKSERENKKIKNLTKQTKYFTKEKKTNF